MIRFFLPPVRTKNGYTLVELIVVVTILAILSTISFIAYTNMTSEARNTVRKTDMSEMKVRLRGIAQKLGAFPLPSSPFPVTNSGFLALNQGWTDTITTNNGSSFNIDPKSKRPYRYSTTTNRQGYQIGMSLELGSETYVSYVDGDYNPLAPYVFPSLLLATDGTGTMEIHDGVGSGSVNRTKFVVNNGTRNLPYDMNGQPVSTASSFSGILTEAGVRLPWASNYSSCQEIYEGGKNMGPGAYLIISSTGTLTLTECSMNPPIYGEIPVIGSCNNGSTNGCAAGTPINQVLGSCGGNATWNCTAPGGISGGCTRANPVCTTYPGCDTPDIFLANDQVWAACNAGATNAYIGQPIVPCYYSSNDCNSAFRNAIGGTYQWGRNDDVSAQGTPTSVLASTGTTANTVGHSNIILNSIYPHDWIASQNNNLWGGESTSASGGTFTDQTVPNQALMQ